MRARFCYRCGHEFRENERYHLVYLETTGKMVPVCRDDRSCHWQRPGKAAKEVVEESVRRWRGSDENKRGGQDTIHLRQGLRR